MGVALINVTQRDKTIINHGGRNRARCSNPRKRRHFFAANISFKSDAAARINPAGPSQIFTPEIVIFINGRGKKPGQRAAF